MPFTPNIPASGQSLGASRPQINGNFSIINAAWALNHIDYNNSAFGRHKFLQMPEVSVPNEPATGFNEGGVYTSDKKGGFTNLFWKQETTGGDPSKANGESIQMTNMTPSNTPTGRSFLPGGMLIQWGQTTASGTNIRTNIIFNVPFDVAPYVVMLTPYGFTPVVGSTYVADNIQADRFDMRTVNASSGTPVFYMAIGKRET